MGKRLEISYYEGMVQLITAPGISYAVRGSLDFAVFYECLKPLQDDEKVTDNIVGFEIQDIHSVQDSDIPQFDEKFDLVGTDLKDMTIKQIVMIVQEQVKKQEEQSHPGRKIA